MSELKLIFIYFKMKWNERKKNNSEVTVICKGTMVSKMLKLEGKDN